MNAEINPMPPRRMIMHAAVAAGGASAALMHYAATCDDEAELRAAADECLEPALRAVAWILDAVGILPGEQERSRLKLAIDDYTAAPVPSPGCCRVCGCTEARACLLEDTSAGDEHELQPCSWADETRTLCNNPACLDIASQAQRTVEVQPS